MKLYAKILIDNGEDYVFGPGRMQLLRSVRKRGSLRQASIAMGMSYRWAWGRINDAEKNFNTLLLENVDGSKGGRPKELTKEAYELMDWAEEVEKKVKAVLLEAEKTMPDFLKNAPVPVKKKKKSKK